MEGGAELEQGELLEECPPPPYDDPLELEEGELREDDVPPPFTSTTIPGLENGPSAGDEGRDRGRSTKRRSEGAGEEGDDHHRHAKRSKKSPSASSSKGHKSKRPPDDVEEGSDEFKKRSSKSRSNGDDDHGADDGSDPDKKRRKKEDRSSANHHRHHHRDHHRDKDGGTDRSSADGGRHPHSSASPSRDRQPSRDRDRRHYRKDRGRDGKRGPRGHEKEYRDRERRERDDGRSSRRSSDRDSRGRGSSRDRRSTSRSRDRVTDTQRRRRGDDYRDQRADYRRDYRDRRENERLPSSRDEETAERKRMEEEERKKKEEEERYAKMVEEELRKKEKDQTEEEKAQKLIDERRRRRQAILQKYKNKQDGADKQEPKTVVPTTATQVQPQPVQESQMAPHQEAPVVDAAVPPTNVAAVEKEKADSGKENGKEQEGKEQPVKETNGTHVPKAVTHFDMFTELPSTLIPAPEKLSDSAGTTVATGEDELNLQDNWDDEEGYYSFRIGEVIKKRYTIHASHGKGVFSTVLMAKDNSSEGAEVAIKIIRNNDTMYRAGMKEKELLEKITKADPKNKKHCIRVLDSFEYRNHLCLVLEPMHLNLREVIRKFGRDIGITMQAVRTYARQLFLSLKHLKVLNVMHADLKPDNIVLNQNHTVLKLCDFGSASTMDEDNAITPYLVSRFYRAPEIILGLPYDFAIDTWAAGCCLYEMYTGKILFPGKSNNEMLKMHMDAMGPFPRKMLRKSKFWQRYFNQQTFHFQFITLDEVSQQEYVKEVHVLKPLRDLRNELQKAATSEDMAQAGQLADFLQKCLILDPAKRITPEQALSHPFLRVVPA